MSALLGRNRKKLPVVAFVVGVFSRITRRIDSRRTVKCVDAKAGIVGNGDDPASVRSAGFNEGVGFKAVAVLDDIVVVTDIRKRKHLYVLKACFLHKCGKLGYLLFVV